MLCYPGILALLELHAAATAGGCVGRIDDFNDVHGRAIIQLGRAAIQDAVDQIVHRTWGGRQVFFAAVNRFILLGFEADLEGETAKNGRSSCTVVDAVMALVEDGAVGAHGDGGQSTIVTVSWVN